jgi:hypothetical protein
LNQTIQANAILHSKRTSDKKIFQKLIESRNAKLNKRFEESVNFAEFKDDTLYLNSHAQEKCRKLLR